MVLLIDNYDSFTYNLYQYYCVLGQDVRVVRNDALSVEDVRRLAPKLIVISPGPGGPESTGNCMAIVDEVVGRIPLLGICLGMQVLARFFGGEIVRAPCPVHGKNSIVSHDGRGVFHGLPESMRVTRYHSLMVDRTSLPQCLEESATSDDGLVMGLRHRSMKIEGVQFHPEAYMTDHGLLMLRNSLEGVSGL